MEDQQLTKKEKYLLKREVKEQERLRQTREKKIKKGVFLLVSVLLVGGVLVFGLTNYSPRERHPGIPNMEISPKEYDAGTVSLQGEPVKYTYEIKNTGVGDLEVNKIWTSCMCTTARLRVGERRTREFGMHSNPVFRSEFIVPGQTGFLDVTFDQGFHGKEGLGPAVRAVYLLTNDPENKNAEVRLVANVVE